MSGNTNFPTGLDDNSSLLDVSDGVSALVAAHHNNLKEAIKAVEQKLGIDNSGAPTSIDYRLGNPTGGHSHDGASGGGALILTFTPAVLYAECNSPVKTGTVLGGFTNQPFDTFYDRDYVDLVGVIPPEVGLTYASGIFTAIEDGVWALHIGADLKPAPSYSGRVMLNTPNYGYSPFINMAASANPSSWSDGIVTPMRAGDEFRLSVFSQSGASMDLLNGYAALDIVRMSKALQ